MPPAAGAHASARHLEEPAAKNGAMVGAAQYAKQPRERRLRRQPVGHDRVLREWCVVVDALPCLKRAGPPSVGHRQPERRVVAERIRIVLITPALPQQHERRAQQLRERVRDELGLARIDQPLGEPVDHAEPLHHLPQDDGASFRGQPLRPAFDAQRAVEVDTERSRILSHDAPFRAVGWSSQLLPIMPS